jgi:hypothetical protein
VGVLMKEFKGQADGADVKAVAEEILGWLMIIDSGLTLQNEIGVSYAGQAIHD